MKEFLIVSLFFVVFAGVIGGVLFLSGFLIKSMHLAEDVEPAAMAIGAVFSLVAGGLLMKQLHSIVQRHI